MRPFLRVQRSQLSCRGATLVVGLPHNASLISPSPLFDRLGDTRGHLKSSACYWRTPTKIAGVSALVMLARISALPSALIAPL